MTEKLEVSTDMPKVLEADLTDEEKAEFLGMTDEQKQAIVMAYELGRRVTERILSTFVKPSRFTITVSNNNEDEEIKFKLQNHDVTDGSSRDYKVEIG